MRPTLGKGLGGPAWISGNGSIGGRKSFLLKSLCPNFRVRVVPTSALTEASHPLPFLPRIVTYTS